MCPAEDGTAGTPVVRGAAPKLTVGMITANVPLVIPEQFTLRLYVQGYGTPFTVTDRFGGSITTIFGGGLLGLPYGVVGNEGTAGGTLILPYVDFDGRTFATLTTEVVLPYAFLLTDGKAPAPP